MKNRNQVTKLLTKLLFVLLLISSLVSCKHLLSQDPKDLFWDGKLPKQLEQIRSQLYEISPSEEKEIVSRIKNDTQRTDLLPVAVIDSGMDISHDLLQKQIIYKVENNRIVGAGYDVMGNSNFASHIFINPTLFAFGARDVKDGKIVTPQANPLALIKITQDRFTEILIEEINKSPELKNSYFSKLNQANILITGFYEFYKHKNNLQAEYSDNKDRKTIVQFDQKSYASVKDRQLKFIKLLVDQPWIALPDQQQIQALDYITVIEHTDLFLQVLELTFKKLDIELAFEKNIQLINQFHTTFTKEDDSSFAIKEIAKALKFIHWGSLAYDPIFRLQNLFSQIPQFKNMSISQAILLYQKTMQENYEALMKNPKLSRADSEILKKKKNALNILTGIAHNYNRLTANPSHLRKLQSQLRRLMYRTQHPFLEPETVKNDHHTHVAGTIATQDKNIRIYPVRVTTQSISIGSERKKKLLTQTLTHFEEWMNSPLIEKLVTEIESEYKLKPISKSTIIKELKIYLSENDINLVFINDVIRAIDEVGKKRIKLANVSLGTVFKKNYDLNQKKQGLAIDLFSEFARYQIGQHIQRNAPGTLFMIATGNDGDWVDGISKVAFPVGIHSLRLRAIAEKYQLTPPPNNQIRNVLAVSSVSPQGSLTQFGNSIVDLGVPQVFSTGEEIRSTVPGKNSEKFKSLVSEHLVKVQVIEAMVHKYANEEVMDFSDPSKVSPVEMLNNFKLAELQTLTSELLSTQLHAEFRPDRERMSGTSMATPTATGIVAKYVLLKMQKLNVPSEQIYDHPEFQPNLLIEEILKIARPSKYRLAVDVKMLLEGIKELSQSKIERKLNNKLYELFQSSKIRCEQALR